MSESMGRSVEQPGQENNRAAAGDSLEQGRSEASPGGREAPAAGATDGAPPVAGEPPVDDAQAMGPPEDPPPPEGEEPIRVPRLGTGVGRRTRTPRI